MTLIQLLEELYLSIHRIVDVSTHKNCDDACTAKPTYDRLRKVMKETGRYLMQNGEERR